MQQKFRQKEVITMKNVAKNAVQREENGNKCKPTNDHRLNRGAFFNSTQIIHRFQMWECVLLEMNVLLTTGPRFQLKICADTRLI